ncbi:LysR family transcriptional regulator [Actinoplanes sp. TBRC 11911]|uniref:LysR family transcriptional regulator n=1 Tax=Actinoplanes sp. TBRC 11911 TaxID=2729386 RepID=UPI00145C95F6|nr:LysR family transcriptional regulator [Actinoplanes sp. TBRC 11911]NMO57858.1 LysR family transcriptional regulator [Actinoplanes sp. TBRC 11911]
MELRQLEVFVAVAAERSFTRAGNRLHVVQSAVSVAVAALERELGVVLFERSARRVALTAEGEVFLPHAQATLDAARAAHGSVRELSGQLGGTLMIGSLTGVAGAEIAHLLSRLHAAHPRVTLRMRAGGGDGSAGLARALVDGDLDVAFVGVPARAYPGLRTRELVRVPQVLVVPMDHPMARREAVSLADVADEAFVDYPVGYANRDTNDAAFSRAGVRRRVVAEVNDLPVVTDFVKRGVGVSILPVQAAQADEAFASLQVSDQPLEWSVHVATAEQRTINAAAMTLLRLVEQRPDRPRSFSVA